MIILQVHYNCSSYYQFSFLYEHVVGYLAGSDIRSYITVSLNLHFSKGIYAVLNDMQLNQV